MFEIFRERLAVRLSVLAAVAVAAGFTLSSTVNTHTLQRATARLHRESAGNLAASIGSAVRTTMLAGDGAHVRGLIEDVKSRVPNVGVRVFSPQGEEVFGEKPSAPHADQVPVWVRTALANGKPLVTGARHSLPIALGAKCGACHVGRPVMGVLTVSAATPAPAGATANAAPTAARADSATAELDALTEIIRDGFYRVMLAPKATRLDEYLADVTTRVPGVRGAAIYAPDKALVYGKAVPRDGGSVVRVATLKTEPRCLGCHEKAAGVDGSTLVVAFDRSRASQAEMLPTLVESVLEQVMQAGLGRLVIGFLDDVAHTGAVRTLTLHDADGRLFHDAFGRITPPAEVDSVLRTGNAHSATNESGTEFLFVEPLRNTTQCQKCHGSDLPLRGAVEVRLDVTKEHAELASMQRGSALYGVATIVLVLILVVSGRGVSRGDRES